MHNVLILDDEKVQSDILGEILKKEGFDVTALTDPEQALAVVQGQAFDLVISDLKMPKMDGIEFLRRLHKIQPDLTAIIMTAHGTVETAVRAMREGAFDYVTKPFSKEEFLVTIQRAVKNLEILRENSYLREELGLRQGTESLVWKSQAMQNIYRMVAKIAQDDRATVLIQGETGTGKNVVARAIHQMSPRRDSPLIAVNCAAIPEGLMESEFFGHEKGAFTGAVAARPGRFELADRGTLFLDEVGELNAYIQGKLLRVIEMREFERVGGTRTHSVNVRIIAATNKNLQEEVRAGRFREDLFYRLNILPITLPPLRERKEDIPLLAEHFLKGFHLEGKRRVQLSPEALEVLIEYRYPGNVRELENILERAVILTDEKVITPNEISILANPPGPSFPAAPEAEAAPAGPGGSLIDVGKLAAERAESAAILDTLRKNNWNRVKAAKALGVDYKTLRLKMRRYGLLQKKE